jgi:hypothetical protein
MNTLVFLAGFKDKSKINPPAADKRAKRKIAVSLRDEFDNCVK